MSPPASCCGTTPRRWITRPEKPPMRIFTPLRSARDLISLRNQPPFWCRCCRGEADDAGLGEELVDHVLTAALVEPRVLGALAHQEGNRGGEAPGRVLAEIVEGGGVRHLDRAGRDGVDRLQAAHDLAGAEGLDLELVVRRLGHELRDHLGGAVDGVERLREARGEAPLDLGRRVGDGRGGDDGRSGGGHGRAFQELPSLHEVPPLFAGPRRGSGGTSGAKWKCIHERQ